MVTARENLAAWHLSCGGRRAPLALTVYGRAVSGGSRASLCPANSGDAGGDPAPAGGGSGRALELCWEESKPAMDLDCPGRHYPSSHCLPRRRPQWPERGSIVGEDSHRVSGARSVLYGSV